MPGRHLVDAHCSGADRRPRLTHDDRRRGATTNQAGNGEHGCANAKKFHANLTSCRFAKLRFNVVAAAVGRHETLSVAAMCANNPDRFARWNRRLGCRPALLKSGVKTQPAQHPHPEKSGIPDQGASFQKPHARFPATPPTRICRRSLPLLALLQSALPNRRYREGIQTRAQCSF